jgi:hypothetical protein
MVDRRMGRAAFRAPVSGVVWTGGAAEACCRVVRQFKNGTVPTGGSMDRFVRYPTRLRNFVRVSEVKR